MPYIMNNMKQVFVFNECIKKWAQFGWMQTNYVSPISLHATDILLSSVAMQKQFNILLHTHIFWRYPYYRYIQTIVIYIIFLRESVEWSHTFWKCALFYGLLYVWAPLCFILHMLSASTHYNFIHTVWWQR